jgi:hypothetical protein
MVLLALQDYTETLGVVLAPQFAAADIPRMQERLIRSRERLKEVLSQEPGAIA